MRRLTLVAAAAFTTSLMSSAAFAGPPSGTAEASIGGCAFAEAFFGATTVNCSGYYPGQIMDGSVPTGDVATQINALADLGITGLTTANFDFNYATAPLNNSSTALNFSNTPMSGLTVIGVHWGNIDDPNVPATNGASHDYTAFFEFDLAPNTTSIPILSFTGPGGVVYSGSHGLSGATLYQTGASALPEPATWAMMIFGFGAAGIGLRRNRRKTALISQLA